MSEAGVQVDGSPRGGDLSETAWKQRFAVRLAELFAQGGLAAEWALADAEAHADDHYPRRAAATPEHEAESVHRGLSVEQF